MQLESTFWTSKTPSNPKELELQTAYIQNQILQHQDSSPTAITNALAQLEKGAQIIMHSAKILNKEVIALQQANAHKKRSARLKNKHLRQCGILTIQEGQEIVQGDSNTQVIAEQGGNTQNLGQDTAKSEVKRSRCRLCQQSGHNSRTCLKRQNSIVPYIFVLIYGVMEGI